MNGTLIDHGITVFVFYEGIWDKRLKYLAELPKGKTVGWFQSSDIFKVKEVLGDTMCILGGMPVSMLSGGTVEQVRERTKNEILLNLFGYTRGERTYLHSWVGLSVSVVHGRSEGRAEPFGTLGTDVLRAPLISGAPEVFGLTQS